MNRPISAKAGRLGRRSLFTVITVLIIAGVLALNVLFSALAAENLWFLDLTTYERVTTRTDANGQKVKITTNYEMYTLTQGVIDLLDSSLATLNAERAARGEEAVRVEIIFCDDPDNLMANSSQRYVLLTALALQKQFPDTIDVRWIDVYKNPSAVQKYKSNSFTTVYSTNVIIASGTEFRRVSLNSFFTFDTDGSSTPWAYNGEKQFASSILAVTKAESPVCCLLTNHGESGYSDAFISLLEDAGYTVVPDFDLEHDEIPENCRLMVSAAPVRDLVGYREIQAGTATVSEIARLSDFLDNESSLLVFFDADTPELPNFEEYLQRWGVSISRVHDEAGEATNYLIKDSSASLTADHQTIVADYVSGGLGKSMTADLQSLAYPSKVVFRNATALTFPSYYKTSYVAADEEAGTPAYTYGTYGYNGVYRQVYDVFLAGTDAQAYAGDALQTKPREDDRYKLMTIAVESDTEPGDINGYTTVSHNSYVLACASTDFICEELLTSNAYGNTDMLSSVLRALGNDNMAARIEQYLKPFAKTTVDTTVVTVSDAVKARTTTLLALIPAVLLFGAGIYVMTKRRYS